ncbi:KTSC domain-containing protein [Aliamphritea ceti]|uniref:KTSC domain-containing protein n=1 Tax=Aliamphritea ceti TaxID=1524258 RepID=UPI0021C3B415|nr:KTSC domain-containing protein [Aliamphritea ceti]
MERTAVSSSNLAAVGYDFDSEILEVEFNSGGVYEYYNVPGYVFQELMRADSLGIYLNQNIKGTYQYSRI